MAFLCLAPLSTKNWTSFEYIWGRRHLCTVYIFCASENVTAERSGDDKKKKKKRCKVLFTVWALHTVLYEQQPWALRRRPFEAVKRSTADFGTRWKSDSKTSQNVCEVLDLLNPPAHRRSLTHTLYFCCCRLETAGCCSGSWNTVFWFKTLPGLCYLSVLLKF